MNVLKTLTKISYGHSKEDITPLYKRFITHPLLLTHSLGHRQSKHPPKQTSDHTKHRPRINTGCTRSTPITHLHNETRVLPLKAHMDMREKHFFSSATDSSFPLHYMQTPRTTTKDTHHTSQTQPQALHLNPANSAAYYITLTLTHHFHP